MTAQDPMFDQRIADWFEDDPDRAPAAILETLAAAVPSIPQRRRAVVRLGPAGRSGRMVLLATVLMLAIVGAALIVGIGRERVPTIAPPSEHAIVASPAATRTPGPKPSPTVSPLQSDGLIVFEHYQADLGTRIEVLQPNGLGKELLPSVKGDQGGPAWNPDGTRLAYAGWDPRDPASRPSIWETDATGAAPRLLSTPCELSDCNEERAPSYSADGTKIVFVRSTGPAGGLTVSTVIAVRDLASGAVTELEPTRIANTTGFVDHPSLSPDGRQVVYALVRTGPDGGATDSAVMRVDVAGGAAIALTPAGQEAGDPSWSPDGTRILFGREPIHHWLGGGKGAGENTFVYTMAADGSDVVELTDAGTDFDSAGSPSWAASGAQVLFVDAPLASVATPDIQVMGSDGTDRRSVARFGDCCRWYPVQQPTP